jgi:hypothetical protein
MLFNQAQPELQRYRNQPLMLFPDQIRQIEQA